MPVSSRRATGPWSAARLVVAVVATMVATTSVAAAQPAPSAAAPVDHIGVQKIATGGTGTTSSIGYQGGSVKGKPFLDWHLRGSNVAEKDYVTMSTRNYDDYDVPGHGMSTDITILHKPAVAKATFDFLIHLGNNVNGTLTANATASTIDGGTKPGTTLLAGGGFFPPTASDAAGKKVPTTYILKHLDTSFPSYRELCDPYPNDPCYLLTQTVDLSAVPAAKFPVKADPDFDWGIISGHLYYNKAETQGIKDQTFSISVICGVASAVYPPMIAICGGYAVELIGSATTAISQGRCVAWEFRPPEVPIVITYDNSFYDYCY